jgi:hypothetical protein
MSIGPCEAMGKGRRVARAYATRVLRLREREHNILGRRHRCMIDGDNAHTANDGSEHTHRSASSLAALLRLDHLLHDLRLLDQERAEDAAHSMRTWMKRYRRG